MTRSSSLRPLSLLLASGAVASILLLPLAPAAEPASGAAAAAPASIPRALPGAQPFPPQVRLTLARALAARGADYEPRTRHRGVDGAPTFTNRLLLEASPYLQQHAHNPVDWWPWGEAAFARARELGRPVFVSIGYSTCHWCHVMEEESFDDPEVARLLNQHFIAIKVDREVRPDVDAIYMAALQTMGQRGGWPLNVFLTPEREPFFGGTYFPKHDRGGRRGLIGVLALIAQRWSQDPDSLDRHAGQIAEAVRASLESRVTESRDFDAEAILDRAARALTQVFDPADGGARGAPKFPATFPTTVLLRQYLRTGEPKALRMAEVTLAAMAAGGIRDHLGGGFHRYATDAQWLVPHFEKMLYDNALLMVDYLEVAQLTGRADFAAIVRETAAYVAREMTAPAGGFYSATDADSRNSAGHFEEGFYFTWTPAELAAVLGAADAGTVGAWYGVTAAGELEGRSVLHRRIPASEVAQRVGKSEAEVRKRVEAARPRLLAARARRAEPARDDKILAGWNGLMISALARAGFVLAEPAYLERAGRAAAFLLDEMRGTDGRLRRVHLDGRAGGPAFLEDYAFVVAGLLDLYEGSGEPRWLAEAQALQAIQDRDFGSPVGYTRTAREGEPQLAREVSARDGAIPSGNSITALNLLRLAHWSGDPTAPARAAVLIAAFAAELEIRPTESSRMLLALDWLARGAREIALVGEPGADFAPMLQPLRRRFDPNRVLSIVTAGDDLAAHARATPLVRGRSARNGRVTAYVCRDHVCDRPTTDPAEFAKLLAR